MLTKKLNRVIINKYLATDKKNKNITEELVIKSTNKI